MDRDAIRAFIRDVVEPAVHPRRVPLAISARHLHGEPVAVEEALAGPFEQFELGGAWGGMWDTTWFRFGAEVPGDWADPVALVHLGGSEVVGFSAEGLVWAVPPGPSSRPVPVQGLHHEHREYALGPGSAGTAVEFYVEAAANPIPPWDLKDWPALRPDYRGAPLYELRRAELCDADRAVEALAVDMRVLLQAAGSVPERSDELLAALASAVAAIDPADVAASAAGARRLLEPCLSRRSTSEHSVTAVGHAHIDSAWLWPVRETRRKCARTFANQLTLMERFPEHRFVCSQAAQYEWMKDGYPELYARIKQRVAEGRWEPVGGMWVESDANVPSGESLVRQLVHGKRFFAEELGFESAELWIPDVFGYSAALPQIARQAGVTALVTQKMSWNDTNLFPHTTFWWEGHDGSTVLAHFPPADTYNGEFSAREVAACRDRHKDRERSDRSLYAFGFGDGGGGPTARMLAAAGRLADLEGMPRVQIGTVSGFLDEVRAGEAAERPLATWSGELYLEAHRGTYTTHADIKLANRRCEEALRAAEMWSVAAGLDRGGELDRAWKLLLFNQFHDIIPGSSIGWVYDDAARDHAEVLRVAGAVQREAQGSIAGGADLVFNAAAHDRTEAVDLPGGPSLVWAPACGWAPLQRLRAPVGTAPVTAGDRQIDNGILRVRWDPDGLITSVWDHTAGREVIAEGERANVFQLHEDHPRAFDAWDVDREYLETVSDLVAVESVELVELGPVRASVRVTRRFGSSRIVQVVRLAAGSRRLEFRTDVDWHEDHKFLKVAFPVAIRSQRAAFEIQHGFVERPTVANTTWDEARFEVCAHRWADLSEPGYGVALLNDCKYGYDVRGHTMRLSLLRAPGYPDPEADRGKHRFSYALLPHPGDIAEGKVVEEAEAFNLPLATTGANGDRGARGAPGRLVEIDRQGVSVEAVKWADAGDGVVVRVCEVHGSRGPVTVKLNRPSGAVWRTDLLERRFERTEASGPGAVRIHLRPFELVTLLFEKPATPAARP